MSLIANIEHLHVCGGIEAVAVVSPNQPRSFRGNEQWCQVLDTALRLFALTSEPSIRMVVGNFTLLIQREGPETVGIVLPTGHAIAKSLRRMIRRMARKNRSPITQNQIVSKQQEAITHLNMPRPVIGPAPGNMGQNMNQMPMQGMGQNMGPNMGQNMNQMPMQGMGQNMGPNMGQNMNQMPMQGMGQHPGMRPPPPQMGHGGMMGPPPGPGQMPNQMANPMGGMAPPPGVVGAPLSGMMGMPHPGMGGGMKEPPKVPPLAPHDPEASHDAPEHKDSNLHHY